MSTKIYNGKRIALDKLEDYMLWFREYNYSNIKLLTEKLMGCISEDKLNERKDFLLSKNEKLSEYTDFDKVTRLMMVFLLYIGASKQHMNSCANVDCFVKIFPYKGHAYLIPCFNSKEPDEYPSYIGDFAYWNNTDRPDDIALDEWDNRRDVWNDILDNEHHRRIVYEVVNASECRCHGLLDIEKMILGDNRFMSPSFMACLYYEQI